MRCPRGVGMLPGSRPVSNLVYHMYPKYLHLSNNLVRARNFGSVRAPSCAGEEAVVSHSLYGNLFTYTRETVRLRLSIPSLFFLYYGNEDGTNFRNLAANTFPVSGVSTGSSSPSRHDDQKEGLECIGRGGGMDVDLWIFCMVPPGIHLVAVTQVADRIVESTIVHHN
jgi:hypothetical protein